MKRIYLLPCVLALLLQSAALHAGGGAPEATPAAFVKTVSADVLTLLNGPGAGTSTQDAQLRQLLQSSVDLKGVGRFVLDRHWRNATTAQREEYQTLFSDYLMTRLIHTLRDDPVRDISVTDWTAPPEQDATVRTLVVRNKADRLEWIWQVRETGGGYRAVDLISSGVSLARTLRAEFRAYVDVYGIDALLQVLRSKRT